jgi:tetrahydromethanopterin S-methyltransferase subunit G
LEKWSTVPVTAHGFSRSFGFIAKICHKADMSESKIKNPSPLVQAVLTLDEHFSDLNRLASRVEEIDLKSNFDFEQSERLITRFAEAGQAISEDIGVFVKVLNETREKAELAAQKVSAKADILKGRKEDIQEKMGRFQVLSDKVTLLNQSLMQFQRPAGEAYTAEEAQELKSRLNEISSQLQPLIEEAQQLKTVGYDSKMKVLEQNAESLRQSLIAVNQKITGMNQALQ